MVCSTVLVEAAVSIMPRPTQYNAGSASHSEVDSENTNSAAPAVDEVQASRPNKPRIPERIAR
jgi:hypothetical protein